MRFEHGLAAAMAGLILFAVAAAVAAPSDPGQPPSRWAEGLGAGAAPGHGDRPPAAHGVAILWGSSSAACSRGDYCYFPSVVRVEAGDSVVWSNLDSARHDVAGTAGGEAFSSRLLAEGQTFERAYGVPGTYEYRCTAHPWMEGTVVVSRAGQDQSAESTMSAMNSTAR